jgi:phosphatidylglycerol:prolipoprotein diacylglycerol transferase
VYPQLVHFGRFFLPTYGFLVSMGVLLGLWISVRNSERLGIDGDKAWNFGILVVLSGIIGAKLLYIINEWGYYSTHPSEIFTVTTLQAGGVFSGGTCASIICPRSEPAMLSHPGWLWATRLDGWDVSPQDAATAKRRTISGG